MTHDVDALVRGADPAPSVMPYDEEGTRRLLARATASMPVHHRPDAPRSTRRTAAASLAMAALAVAFVAAQALLSSPAALAGIDFVREGSNYIVTVTEPERDAGELTAALKAKGLNITISTVPASPSRVGMIVGKYRGEGSDVLRPLHEGPCLPGHDCKIGFVVPVDFQGTGGIEFGRAARAGEDYVSSTRATNPGERLACQELIGKPVPDVLRVLDAEGLTVLRRAPTDVVDEEAFLTMRVTDIASKNAKSVYLFAQAAPVPSPRLPDGC